MYSSKENVSILTSLLVAHGVTHAVVCPGSRNAPIVHNLSECPQIACHPVTDERSAAFYALGMAQALAQPVVVCVTSGSALLNVAPAVAEAYYQHLPLVVVSADRPQQWIGQLDGQTLPQPGALGCFVRRSVTLPEVLSPTESLASYACSIAEQRWLCNRLVNEALLDATADDPMPVHINVPISEPLFSFSMDSLPQERVIRRYRPLPDFSALPRELVDGLAQARRPMLVFGQAAPGMFEGSGTEFLFSHVIVLHESLAPFPHVSHFDEVLFSGGIDTPDFIVYVGNTIVSKRLRQFLRSATQAQAWRIGPSAEVEDTFMQLRGIVVGDADFILQSLSQRLSRCKSMAGMDYRRQWLHRLSLASRQAEAYQPPFSQMAAVKTLEERLSQAGGDAKGGTVVHYANSTAIRLANIYAAHHVWCNRGVNGIEGSLSTAAGFSVVSPGRVVCVVGDLSFFYDQNALWNQNLRGNLRILLLNNGRGGIFNMLRGLEQSPVRDSYVAAAHQTTAEGICQQNNVGYHRATTMEQLHHGLDLLLGDDSSRPMLLEVTTDVAVDERVFKHYFLNQKQAWQTNG